MQTSAKAYNAKQVALLAEGVGRNQPLPLLPPLLLVALLAEGVGRNCTTCALLLP